MQSTSALRRRRIGQVLVVLAVLWAVGSPFLFGALGLPLPFPVAHGVTIALLLFGMALILRGDRSFDRGFDGADDTGASAAKDDPPAGATSS